jgi:thermolabile hemolysin
MSRTLPRAALPALALALFAGTTANPLHAQENAFDRELTAQVRCWYKVSPDPTRLETRYVEADSTLLRGHWRSVNSFFSGALFFTLQEPEEVNDACRRTLALRGLGDFVQASVASTRFGKNFPVWHDTDIDTRRGQPVERIVAFGDSLSDTGNIYTESQQTMPIHSSWLLGRFSNGPVWTEHLARRTGLTLTTWATGGAQGDRAHGVIASIEDQVKSFMRYARMGVNPYDPSRTLFTVLIGGNDFVNAGREPEAVVADVEKALRTLLDFGARKVVVVGLPDLTRAPTFRALPGVAGDAGRGDAEAVYAKVRAFNAAMPIAVRRLAASTAGTELVFVDTAARFDALLADPGAHGFAEVDKACLDIHTRSAHAYLTPQSVRPGCDPRRSVFWDLLHPTSRAHEMISTWVLDDLPEAWALR